MKISWDCNTAPLRAPRAFGFISSITVFARPAHCPSSPLLSASFASSYSFLSAFISPACLRWFFVAAAAALRHLLDSFSKPLSLLFVPGPASRTVFRCRELHFSTSCGNETPNPIRFRRDCFYLTFGPPSAATCVRLIHLQLFVFAKEIECVSTRRSKKRDGIAANSKQGSRRRNTIFPDLVPHACACEESVDEWSLFPR